MPHAPRLGPRPKLLGWDTGQAAPVLELYWTEYPAVKARSVQEVNEWRELNGIAIVEAGNEVPKPLLNMEESSFPDWVADTMRRTGHKDLTPVQAQLWPIVGAGRDAVAIAATGSGKTLAYGVPMIWRAGLLPGQGSGPCSLLLVPTVELAHQVKGTLETLAEAGKVQLRLLGDDCWKGDAPRADLCRDAIVALGTPRQAAEAARLSWFHRRLVLIVCDEADALCEEPYVSDVMELLGERGKAAAVGRAPCKGQLLCVSATWPDSAYAFCRKHMMRDAISFHASTTGLSASQSVRQNFEMIHASQKPVMLRRALELVQMQFEEGAKAVVFCNSGRTCDEVAADIRNLGFAALVVHEYVPEASRLENLREFRRPGGVPVLVATSLIGRGHDFTSARFVINYDLAPRLVEYLHRIGRCGRSGMQGYSMTFLTPQDFRAVAPLIKLLQEAGKEVPQALAILANRGCRGLRDAAVARRRGDVCIRGAKLDRAALRGRGIGGRRVGGGRVGGGRVGGGCIAAVVLSGDGGEDRDPWGTYCGFGGGTAGRGVDCVGGGGTVCGAGFGPRRASSQGPPLRGRPRGPPLSWGSAAARPGAGGRPVPRDLPGEWHCSSCGVHQFAVRNSCRQCGALRRDVAEVGIANPVVAETASVADSTVSSASSPGTASLDTSTVTPPVMMKPPGPSVGGISDVAWRTWDDVAAADDEALGFDDEAEGSDEDEDDGVGSGIEVECDGGGGSFEAT